MSYMDRKNIISEGFLDFLKNLFNTKGVSKKERKAMLLDPGFRKSVKKFQKDYDEFQRDLATFK